jgi:ferric-dicitrate binding protein FerR (iron transport regulator)
MHDATESKRLLAVLRDRPLSVDPARTEALRARAMPRLEERVRVIAGQRKRVTRRRIFVGWLAAIVTVLVAAVALRELRGSPSTTAAAEIRALDGHLLYGAEGTERAVLPGDRLSLPADGELRTDSTSQATVETSHGLRLRLESGSKLGLSGLSSNGLSGSVHLEQGQVQCAVPKLQGGARFAVVTPNARVVVHGTRFSVRVDSTEAGVTRTCVRVTEGVVAVQHAAAETFLHAGDEWGCGSDQTEASPVASPKPAPPVTRGKASLAKVQGTLAEETALLQTALAAERKGRSAAASVAAARLVARFPDSPLAPEARAVLDRVSQKSLEGR